MGAAGPPRLDVAAGRGPGVADAPQDCAASGDGVCGDARGGHPVEPREG